MKPTDFPLLPKKNLICEVHGYTEEDMKNFVLEDRKQRFLKEKAQLDHEWSALKDIQHSTVAGKLSNEREAFERTITNSAELCQQNGKYAFIPTYYKWEGWQAKVKQTMPNPPTTGLPEAAYCSASPVVEKQQSLPVGWQPIDTAPKDNKRKLYLAYFNEAGELIELDFDGSWEYWEESWEMPHVNGYAWTSMNGIEEPTHWAYQDEPLPPAKKLNFVHDVPEHCDRIIWRGQYFHLHQAGLYKDIVAYGIIASNTGEIAQVVLAKDYEEECLGALESKHVVPLYR